MIIEVDISLKMERQVCVYLFVYLVFLVEGKKKVSLKEIHNSIFFVFFSLDNLIRRLSNKHQNDFILGFCDEINKYKIGQRFCVLFFFCNLFVFLFNLFILI